MIVVHIVINYYKLKYLNPTLYKEKVVLEDVKME